MSTARKPIPGTAEFLALRRRFPTATCWATCESGALSREKDTRAFLRLPSSHDPAAYHWPVSGREVVLIGTDTDDRRILATCRALLRNGALKITIIHGENWRMPRLTIVSAKAVRHAA